MSDKTENQPVAGGGEEVLEAARRIVAWDDAGRLADDEWLVERNETAIIAICRALLSSPRVERERKMREALEAINNSFEKYKRAGAYQWVNSTEAADAFDLMRSALSLQVE